MTKITEWLLASSTLIVFIFILRAVFAGKVNRKGIYMLWALAAVRLLIPINFTASPMSIMNLFSAPQTAMEEADTKHDTNSPAMDLEKSDLTYDTPVITRSKNGNPKHQQLSDTASVANADTIPETGVQTPEKTEASQSRTSIIFIVWGAGFVSLLLMFTVCNIILHRRLKYDRKYVGNFRGLGVYYSQVFQIPCLYGLFHPTIYLPESIIRNIPDVNKMIEDIGFKEQEGEFNTLSTDKHNKSLNGDTDSHRMNQILIHEWVHYRHRDPFWSALRIFLLAAYWFHPLVWAAAICSKKDAEFACDEKTLALLGEQERISYGTMLIDMAVNVRSRMTLYLTTPVSRQGKSLKQRICALEKRNYSKVMACTLIVSVLLLTGTTFTGCVSGAGSQGAGNAPASIQNAENNMSDVQTDWENLYSDFLKEHQNEKEFSYYSVISLSDTTCPTLLTTDKTIEKEYVAGQSPAIVTNTGHLYSIVEKKVTYLGDITCENNNEWLHCSDGKLMSTSPDSVSKQWVDAEGKEIQTKTLKNEPGSIGNGGSAATPADDSFDGEAETPATSADTPQIKSKHYGYPDQITSYYVDAEPETPASSTEDISDEEDTDTVVIYDDVEGDYFWVWRNNFEIADSVIFYPNTEDTLAEIASRNYLMHILTEDSVNLNIDITGDGVNDTISIDVNAAKGQSQTVENSPAIRITSGKTDNVIWKSDANASLHAGYNQFYLYHKKINTYLMEWNPACWQGYCSYQWKVFKLTDDGKVKKIAGNKVEFDTNEGRIDEKDFDKIETFGKELNTYLANAELLLDTVPEETLGIPEDGTSDEPIRVFGNEQQGESYFDYEAVIRELKAKLKK